jgi:hypothetical protein
MIDAKNVIPLLLRGTKMSILLNDWTELLGMCVALYLEMWHLTQKSITHGMRAACSQWMSTTVLQ